MKQSKCRGHQVKILPSAHFGCQDPLLKGEFCAGALNFWDNFDHRVLGMAVMGLGLHFGFERRENRVVERMQRFTIDSIEKYEFQQNQRNRVN
jgi:hypothetical protein